MPSARIIDETGRTGLWSNALREVLAGAGYGLEERFDESAGLTVLLENPDARNHEEDFRGDLLVITIPPDNSGGDMELGRTEVTGSSRLKARHRLSETEELPAIADEIRPLVKLFIH